MQSVAALKMALSKPLHYTQACSQGEFSGCGVYTGTKGPLWSTFIQAGFPKLTKSCTCTHIAISINHVLLIAISREILNSEVWADKRYTYDVRIHSVRLLGSIRLASSSVDCSQI